MAGLESIIADIERRVSAAAAEVADKCKICFQDQASANIEGTGDYVNSITVNGGGMDYTILADPNKMGSEPDEFWHGSFGRDAREGMTAILGDGKCGPLFGENTRGTNRPAFWNTVNDIIKEQFDSWARQALIAQGLNVK